MKRVLAAVLTALLPAASLAQEMHGADGPVAGSLLGDGPRAAALLATSAKRRPEPARRLVLPSLDVERLLAQDARAAASKQKSNPRVGVIRRFRELRAPPRLLPGRRGVEALPDGSLLWSAEVSAPGAVGLRLHVARCELPQGAELTVSDAAEPAEAYGPFAALGSRGTGEFHLPTVFGETVRIELRVPAKSAGTRLRLALDRLAQHYREGAEELDHPRGGPVTRASGCNNSVACDASYAADVARAIATLSITSEDGVYLCTGALLNDSDPETFTPWFLTARHCIGTESEAADTEFYFDYRAPTCDGVPPSRSSVPRVSGAVLVATSSSNDFTFLRLTGTLPANRHFCGWTTRRPAIGAPVVGVHHPGGQHMRISYGALVDEGGSYHDVQWHDGVTAGGSSGSPLFNEEKQVIGQLYGGSSSCSYPDGIDEYGRFDRTYPAIAQHLGDGSGKVADPQDPADDSPSGATPLAPGVSGATHGPHSLSADDAADWFALDLVAGERYRIFAAGQDDVRARLYADEGATALAAQDDDSAGSQQFSIDFVPAASGRHLLVVETAGGARQAEYVLHSTQVDAAAVVPALAVGRLRRELAGMSVTLRWRDRARSEAGYYVELSADGGGTWARVAELPRNARTFAHEPGPGAYAYRVGAWNAASTVRWRHANVRITDPDQVDSFDPVDDTGAGATQLEPAAGGTTSTRSLSRADFEDWYRIELAQGRSYEFWASGGLDTVGDVFRDADGVFHQAQDDDSGPGRNFRVAFVAPRTATYWLRVAAYEDGDVGTYTLSWRER